MVQLAIITEGTGYSGSQCSSGPPFISVFFVIREGLDISTAASMVNIFSITFKETLVIDDEGRAFLYRGKI